MPLTTAVRAAQFSGASMARSMDNISEREAAPSRRRIRATWCSTVFAEMNSWPPMSRYGIPNNSSSATSRSRSDSGEPAAGWRGAEGAPVRRRAPRCARASSSRCGNSTRAADPHAFEELRLLSQLRSRPTTLNEDEIVSLRRIIGGSGTNPASRLGLNPQDPYADPHEGPRAALPRRNAGAAAPSIRSTTRSPPGPAVRLCAAPRRWWRSFPHAVMTRPTCSLLSA